MIKPKFLYHGSGVKKDKLVPRKAYGFGKKEDKLKGVYATRVKDFAVVMGILSGVKGFTSAGLKGKKVEGIIYDGEWPEQDYFYLYTVVSKGFENLPKGSHQYVSFKSVKPIKTEKLLIKDYLSLIRKANVKEKLKFKEKYNLK